MDSNKKPAGGNDSNATPKKTFWGPLGFLGWLWRWILFLVGIILICLLLSYLMKGCNSEDHDPLKNNPYNPFGKDFIFTNPRTDTGKNPGPGDSRFPVSDKDDDSDKKPGKKESPWKDYNQDDPDDPFRDDRDRSPVKDWGGEIPGVPELPPPDENFIPPVDSSSIIPDPDDKTAKILGDELIVFFNSKDLKKDMADFAKKFKEVYPEKEYSVSYYNPSTGMMRISVPPDEMEKVRKELNSKIPDIKFIVAPNEIMRSYYTPNDPKFKTPKYDEYFKLIQAYDAWDITKGSPDVKVAIIDSHFDLSNPELAGRYVDPVHIPSKTKDVYPPAKRPTLSDITIYSHGSHVAGIAIGAQDNGLGVSGIAPNCTWIPIALGNEMTALNIYEAILYAIYHDADVINLSIGRSFPDGISAMPLKDQIDFCRTDGLMTEALWKQIVEIADDHNCTIVTSAGNERILMGMDPKKREEGVITVEAVDGKGIAANFSNFGIVPEADIHYSTVAAPGMSIWSTTDKRSIPLMETQGYVVDQENGFQEMNGTSMASPIVAGAVALLKSKNKNLTNAEIKKILTMTAKQTDTKHRIGPVIQIKDALDATPSGEIANFDDLMKDHNLLVGKWKSTKVIDQVDAKTEEKIDELWVYFIFTTPNSGQIEYHAVNSKNIYKANVTVSWGKSDLTITMTSDATCSGKVPILKDVFSGRPDGSRQLMVTAKRKDDPFSFKLEKVK